MIRHDTVFVLGAGASAPYGFPLGRSLMKSIWRQLDDGTDFKRCLLEYCGLNKQRVVEFRRDLAKCGRASIDEFLQGRPDYLDVGKAAIARALLPLESDGALYAEHPDGGDPWYDYLFNQLFPGGNHQTWSHHRLSIVTFNFDRSFERALFLFLTTNFRLSDVDAANICVQIPIVHLHGQFGEPSWLVERDGARPFAVGDLPREVTPCANQIRIVNEEIATADVEDAAEMVQKAQTICFIGFGYHHQNLDRFPVEHFQGKTVRGTCYKMPDGPKGVAERWFGEKKILWALDDWDALKFFEETNVIHA